MDYNPFNYQQFGIPSAAEVDYAYVGAAAAPNDTLATATYKNESGNTLGVLTFTFLNGNITKIQRTS